MGGPPTRSGVNILHYTTLYYLTHLQTSHHTAPHCTTRTTTTARTATTTTTTLVYTTLHCPMLHYTLLILAPHMHLKLHCTDYATLHLRLRYRTLHPAVMGEVTTDTVVIIPKTTTPTIYRSINGFALPSDQPLL